MKTHVSTRYLVLFLILILVDAERQLAQTSNSPRLFAPGVISGAADDLSPAFTPDGRTVFFTRRNASTSMILVSQLVSGEWSRPVIAPFSGKWNDLEPAMSPDGSFLVFASNRPADDSRKPIDGNYNGQVFTAMGGNLWRVDRQGNSWGEPKRLPDTINADTGTFSPSIVSDGSIYFMRPAKPNGHFELFRSQYRGGTYEAAVPIGVGDNTTEDVDPAVAPDESFIIYSSNHPERRDQKRLLIVFPENGKGGTPIDLGDEVNEKGNNVEARLGSDHTTLYFSTNTVPPVSSPYSHEQAERALEDMQIWATGRENIWYVSLEPWLQKQRK